MQKSFSAPIARAHAAAGVALALGASLSLGSCIPKKAGAPAGGASGQSDEVAPLHVVFAAPVATLSAPILSLRRGINLGNGLDAPHEGAWGVVLSEKHFEMAAAAGLDHVRLPVRFNAYAGETAPFTVEEAFFAKVDWAIEQALSRKLQVIVDFHHYEELMKDPAAHEERFIAIWRQIAERYKGRPKEVLFELLNEPNSELTAPRWNALAKRAVAAIRETNPERVLIVDSYFWAAAVQLKNLELPADPQVVASFHMYQPILFTHQGAPWMDPEFQTQGIVFPGPPKQPVTAAPGADKASWVLEWIDNYNRLPTDKNPSGPAAVAREFDMATRFVESTGARLYLGEFGAIDKADAQSRENYLRLVRRESERRGIAWAIWDDGGMNRAMDVKQGSWEPVISRALFNGD